MLWDQTQLAIRQRGLLETLDLALLVVRQFGLPLLRCTLAVIVPLALGNHALVGWMAQQAAEEARFPAGYLFSMALLVFLESPLLAAAVVAYLGPAVFGQQRSLREVLHALVQRGGALLMVHGLARGILPAWGLMLAVDRLEGPGPLAVLGWLVLVPWVALVRTFRPYVNEVLLLEQMSLGPGRSQRLHSPAAGTLLLEGMVLAAVGVCLSLSVVLAGLLLWGVLFSDWPLARGADSDAWQGNWGGLKLHLVCPAGLWVVGLYLAVVRFLRYLDLRIRNEGWEIELQVRAEARRLASEPA